jgi:large subunit ribosomal protein L18
MRSTTLKRKTALRIKRKLRTRAKISGCASTPRVSIFKSNKHVYAQAIDDVNGVTLCSADGAVLKVTANKEGAKVVAKALAEGLQAKGISKVVFDKNGYQYHGVVAAFADALRENEISL